MAALRKLKNLVENLTQPSVEDEPEPRDADSSGVFFTGFEAPRQPLPNPEVDRDLLSALPQLYFEEGGADPGRHELEGLEETAAATAEGTLELDAVAERRALLRKQLDVVCRMLSDAVLQNSTAFQDELARVVELQEGLKNAVSVAASSRRSLAAARDDFTGESLRLYARTRRRSRFRFLLESLKTIRRLRATDAALRAMVDAEDYARAIELCLDCRAASLRHRQHQCIAELGSKLQDTLELIEEGLDVALGRIPQHFDCDEFAKLQKSYAMLGKTETSVDQLLMHFASTIHNLAFNIVLGHVELAYPQSSFETTGEDDSYSNPFGPSRSQSSTSQSSSYCSSQYSGSNIDFRKKQYSDLCRFIPAESFVPCLVDLSKELFGILRNYDSVMGWYKTRILDHQDALKDATLNEDPCFGTPPPPPPTISSSRRPEADVSPESCTYVRQKLEHGVSRIWQDVQQKVKVYLLASDLSSYKFDDFMQVLRIGNTLIAVGAQFCPASSSEGLRDGMKKQSINYFKHYHRACLDELRMFLENEGWVLLPVKSTFTLEQLYEFRFLRKQNQSKVDTEGSNRLFPRPTANSVPGDVFACYVENSSPFDALCKEEEFVEDVWADDSGDAGDSDSESEELKREAIEEDEDAVVVHSIRHKKPIRPDASLPLVTNATLNVLRLIGKYLQMMQALEPIAFDVFVGATQLYEFLFYSTFLFFGRSQSTLLGGSNVDSNALTGSLVGDKMLPSRLRGTLKRVREELILRREGPTNDANCASDKGETLKVAAPNLSPILSSTEDEAALFCFAERVAASESLVYLSEQVLILRPHFEKLLAPGQRQGMQQFYAQSVAQAVELRRPVYRVVAVQAVNYESVLNSIAVAAFDIDEIMSQHSQYIDDALRELRRMARKVGEVAKSMPVPAAVTDVLWEHVIRLASRTFVEGYACTKKCSNEGRALMQLDYQQFLSKLEQLTDLRPIPDRDYVEGYIKAFYLPEPSLEQWVLEKKGIYSKKQMSGLVGCVSHLNKKAKQQLLTLIDDVTNS